DREPGDQTGDLPVLQVLAVFASYITAVVEWRQGDKSVLLPFNPTADLPQEATVVWRLTVFKHTMVHVYERGKDQPDKQDPGYRGRTEMNEDPLRTKDLSLTLKDLQLTDSEDYTCTVYNKGGDKLLQKVVLLRVTGEIIYILRFKSSCLSVCLCSESLPDIMPVPEGEESVLLPFKTTADLPQDVTVEWTRSDSNNKMVHVFESGNNQPDEQDQGYRGRTEMNEDPLSTKDLSLTLKDLHLTDSGVYTCTVYKKDGDKLQKSVTLSVTGECNSCLSTYLIICLF
uniref:Ig-like domain-containing protein n=1 Tax=Maylandia zebra TaxID=106582 RepID=A0A3P9DT18_9CICH